MEAGPEVRYDGPELHVDLPERAIPDWVTVRREIDLEAGIERAFIAVPSRLDRPDEAELVALIEELRRDGADVYVTRLPGFAERFLG
jgi:hypothetical protein